MIECMRKSLKLICVFANLLLLFCCFGSRTFAQSFNYKPVSNAPSFMTSFNEKKGLDNMLRNKKFVNITSYLPKGYDRTGKTDYTDHIQKALYEKKNILMPNFPILVNDKGLDILSNTTLAFQAKSKILLKPSVKTHYDILRIHDENNVKIFSPKIVGDRKQHKGKEGEWGMGISVRSSSNVHIINPQISDCWGDGIYLGQNGQKISRNISITHGLLDNNRRNGISVISVEGLRIENIVIANTNGTNPQAGIDFEPNNNKEQLKDVTVRNIYTFNNKNQGIFYCLNQLNGGAEAVSISLENHLDNYSKNAIAIMNVDNIAKAKNGNIQALQGVLKFKNVEGKNNQVHLLIFDGSNLEGLDVSFDSVNKHNLKTKGSMQGVSLIK